MNYKHLAYKLSLKGDWSKYRSKYEIQCKNQPK